MDETHLARVVNAAEIRSTDEVLEIGPGLGSLTRHLAIAAKRVVTVELDSQFILPLSEVIKPYDNVEVIQGDILEVDLTGLFSQPGYLVVANIPYYITSAVLRYLLEPEVKPARLVLTIQEEVARRICAEQGALSLLAISVQVYGQAHIVSTLPAGAFYPAPNVASAILRVDLFDQARVSPEDSDMFFRIVKAGFSQKRKTLRNALSGGLAITKEAAEDLLSLAGIDPQRRAQTLSLEEWILLMGEWKAAQTHKSR
jgi:16S rRNA (adenine1518-N6/adenine1519-N6)-dimethyltransferase